MKFLKKSLYLITYLIGFVVCAQQISIDNSFTEQQLIENNLSFGCVETSNIQSSVNGQINGFESFAYFEKAGSNFPFNNGIMLSTGNSTSAGNTLNTDILNEGQPDWGADTDLENALGITGTLNATSIEFDFVSASNLIQFNYLLASEEYFGDFPCNYSDGFAFLIREAGSSEPYTNIAIIPETNTPVNTNTIHDDIVGFCSASNETFFEGYNIGDTNYNGRTKVLTATANITPNVTYHIKLVIADQTDKNYDSAVFIEGNSFNANVDLGMDIQTCADNVTLDGNIDNPSATYSWFLNNNLIPGETQPTFNALQSGSYRVEIQIPLAGSNCSIEDEIIVTLSNTQSAEPISNYELCDDQSTDEIETFNLFSKNEEVTASVPPSTYIITYHSTAEDAQNASNPLPSTIENTTNPQTIFVRIEDDLNGCLAFQNFDLIVNPPPIITSPTILIACDDIGEDGLTEIDLSQKDSEITNGNLDLVVSYHFTQNDANDGINPIPLPYANTNPNETIFVNIRNSITGCSNTTSLDIEVLNNPIINTDPHYIDACDEDLDGFAEFDLTTLIDDVLEGLTNVDVTFHETLEDAELGANQVENTTNYTNININEQVLYIRVENQTSGCASVTPIEIHTNLLLTATNIKDFSICDENNDGMETFDLTSIAIDILNNVDEIMEYAIDITFYLSESDRDNQINPIDVTLPFQPTSNPQMLYIVITSPFCEEISEFELSINPTQEFDPIGVQHVCNTNQTSFTTIDLSQFDNLSANNLADVSVSYFSSEEDAEANINELPIMYDNISNPETFYTRITLGSTGCSSINSFDVQVNPAPSSSTPSSFIICEENQDGISNVNLESKISEIVDDLTDRTITFHNTLEGANTANNPIINTTSYPAGTETVFVRIENMLSGCYGIQNLEIVVNTIPTFTTISNYKICENFTDNIGDFIFSTKDNEILNGQTGKEVFYFLNETDANAKVNIIDKTVAFQNTSNPQTIVARVENLSDSSCFNTTSFTLEVGTNPLYTEPINWFVCDDISNDGVALFDLNTKIDEIAAGTTEDVNISFYKSLENAENLVNPVPLQYANSSNPETLFVVIDNGTICNSISSFVLNVIQVPEVNLAQPMATCDEDYDGTVIFDITQAEFEILDVRQDNITVTYFETLTDLEANTNVITNPTSYSNISNPQTIFIKVNNTISNCYAMVPLELVVNLPPAINRFDSYDICENDTNSFNLEEITPNLLEQTSNAIVNYYSSEDDARNEENILNTNYTYVSSNDTLFARVESSTTQCFYVHEFSLNVNNLPIAYQPNDMESCDDNFDGLFTFQLTNQNAQILGNQNPSNFSVTFYLDDILAQEGIANITENYPAITGETIFARVENNTTGCFAVTSFMLTVYEKPFLDIGDQVICLENLPLIVSANTNNIGDIYQWSTGASTPETEILEIGTYSITITTQNGCETTEIFTVSESEAATIEITETIDFSDPNNIVVTISGIGNYLYQLDDNPAQASNIFENVSLGYHIITIKDLNGCSDVSKEIVVVDAPKFFTPNGDSYFDTWHITGIETLTGTVVSIFDRYGKLLKRLDSNSKGWDGYYNGNLMPANDYWFIADVKKGEIAFQVKGHFALRL